MDARAVPVDFQNALPLLVTGPPKSPEKVSSPMRVSRSLRLISDPAFDSESTNDDCCSGVLHGVQYSVWRVSPEYDAMNIPPSTSSSVDACTSTASAPSLEGPASSDFADVPCVSVMDPICCPSSENTLPCSSICNPSSTTFTFPNWRCRMKRAPWPRRGAVFGRLGAPRRFAFSVSISTMSDTFR